MRTDRRLPLYIDLGFCLVLLPFMIWLLPVDRWLNSNATFVALFIGWVYAVYAVNRTVAVPWLFRDRKRMIWALVIIAVTLVVTYLISRYRFNVPPSVPQRKYPVEMTPQTRLLLHQRAVWFLYIVVVAFSFAVGTLAELYRQMVERQAAEHEKKKAELALYKAQINPHFLFNTLNTLYGLMLTDVGRAETAFMQFMHLTKYMYTNAEKEKVPLRAEIDYIRQYIELQRNRLSERTQIHFTYENRDENPAAVVAPMILITFVENALKYGVSSHRQGDIYIDIHIDGDRLNFKTQNPVVLRETEEKSGYGIENCRKRLDLLYPGRHRLEIDGGQDTYTVMLTIDLQ